MSTALELVDVLDRETELLKELLEMLQADQQRIIKHDVEALEASNVRKEERVLQFQSLEQTRVQLTERMGVELEIPTEEVRISRICPLLGADGETLRSAAERLRAVVASLAELIAISHGFLEQSIQGVRSLLSLIQSMRVPEPGAYDATGRPAAVRDPGALSLRKEV